MKLNIAKIRKNTMEFSICRKLTKEGETMYPNLRAEMARRNVTVHQLAIVLNVTSNTMSLKLKGKAPISLQEAIKIKDYLQTDLTLEELFRKEVNEVTNGY